MTSPIVFALDFPTLAAARDAVRSVAPAIGMVKVGLELFIHSGPAAVAIGAEVGLPVFLDLKLHDIPETVERAVAQASALGARLITVHASGGRTMLRRAVARAKAEGGTLDVCAVTILTSLDDADLQDVGFADTRQVPHFKDEEPASHVSLAAQSLARLAYDEGVRWFVCSPAEVAALRRKLGKDAVLVTPGVRPASADKGDQKRVATPESAIRDGADWLVVGRPIRDASDPLAAAQQIAAAADAARRSAPESSP